MSDECPTTAEFREENVFSLRYQLIANSVLRVVVWLMGILAFFGNIVSFSNATITFQFMSH